MNIYGLVKMVIVKALWLLVFIRIARGQGRRYTEKTLFWDLNHCILKILQKKDIMAGQVFCPAILRYAK